MSRTRNAAAAVGVLRSLRPGDRWTYHVSGILTPPGGGPPQILSGTIAVTVEPDSRATADDRFVLTFAQNFQIQRSDGTPDPFPAPDLMFIFVQDPATRDASIVADNMGRGGAYRWARTPRMFYPGRWLLGTRYDNTLEFGDDDCVRNTLLVTGQVPVETPIGMFSAWVAEITSASPALGKISGIDWWTPELGAPVCFETTTSLPDGTRTRIHAMLNDTNVIGHGDTA